MIDVLSVTRFWVICREDEDLNEEFGKTQLREAKSYLKKLQTDYSDKHIEIVAELDMEKLNEF
jgi:hypothetical protein